MAWSNSKVFAYFVKDTLDKTMDNDLDGDTIKASLFNNTPIPDNTVAAASTALGAGQWTGELTSSTDWPAGGKQLLNDACTVSTTTIKYDADDTVSGAAATLSNVYGCLVYDDTLTTPVADQGVCYNYFGGANSVTSGTFTIVWNASGVMSFSVA